MALSKITNSGIGAIDTLDVETASGDATLRVHAAENNSSSEPILVLESSNDFAESIVEFKDSSGVGGRVAYNHGDNALRFQTNGTSERMRIDSDGKVRINRTTGLFTEQLLVESDTTSVNPMTVSNTRSTAATDYSILFARAGSLVGSIQTTLSATSYVTSSDYRLKTNVNYDWDATTRLKQLRPARFEWIADGDDAVPVDGFLAHEVQDIVPEAISGTKDAVDDEGNPVYQGIDQSKLTPLLTKALIEAVEKIEQLEARIAALEAN